jgi:hypothetical protein
VIDDLIDSHPNLIDSYPNEALTLQPECSRGNSLERRFRPLSITENKLINYCLSHNNMPVLDVAEMSPATTGSRPPSGVRWMTDGLESEWQSWVGAWVGANTRPSGLVVTTAIVPTPSVTWM